MGRLRVESRAKGQKPIRSCFPDTPEFDTVRLHHLTHTAAMDALRQVAKPIVEKVDYAMKESPASVGETWERLSRSGLNFQQIAKVVGVLNMVREAGWDGCMARGLTRSGMYDYKKLFREVGIRP